MPARCRVFYRHRGLRQRQPAQTPPFYFTCLRQHRQRQQRFRGSAQSARPSSTRRARTAADPLFAYPNLSRGGSVRLSRPVSGTRTDLTGRPVRQLTATDRLSTSGLSAGVYVLRATDGATSKIVVE